MKIWGRLTSINVRKVVWTAQELGLKFQRNDAGASYGIVKTDAYRAMNPNSLVPTLEDGDFVLWESNVIARYLCTKHASPLFPTELKQRFEVERWMDWQQTTLNPAGREAFIQWIRTPDALRDPAKIAESVAKMSPLLEMLNTHLAQRAFMAGDAFTVADIPVACDIHRWVGLPQDCASYPHLDAWFASILKRPASFGVLDIPLA
jgi:glutathione S-transferase